MIFIVVVEEAYMIYTTIFIGVFDMNLTKIITKSLKYVYIIIVFIQLYSCMITHHPQEFQKNKCTMISQLLIMEIYGLMLIVMHILNNPSKCICDEQDIFVKFMTLVASLIQKLDLNTTIYSFAVLYVKSSDDILQGLTRLDHLIKVSIFQKFKKGGEWREDVTYENVYADE